MRFQVTKNKTVIRREVRSAHSGIDRHRFRVDIPDTAATVMTNFRSSGVARWRKRYEPSLVADLGHDGYRPNGMSEWTDSAGVVRMVVACAGAIHYATAEDTWNHATVVGGISISTTNAVRFQQYDGVLYGVDGESYFKVYNDAGTVKVARVLQPSTNGPIEPGSVSLTDGSLTLTDVATAGELKTSPGGVDKGDINYDTSVGSVESGYFNGSVTADYTRGILKTEASFARAAQDGTLEKPSLLYGGIVSLTLTDGSNTLETSATDVTDNNLYEQGTSNVKGTLDRTNGKIDVTEEFFTPNATITATYAHTKTNVKETLTPNATGMRYDIQMSHGEIVPGTFRADVGSTDYIEDNGVGGLLYTGGIYSGTLMGYINYGLGIAFISNTITGTSWPWQSGGGDQDINVDYDYAAGRVGYSHVASSVEEKNLGTSLPSSFSTDNSPISAYSLFVDTDTLIYAVEYDVEDLAGWSGTVTRSSGFVDITSVQGEGDPPADIIVNCRYLEVVSGTPETVGKASSSGTFNTVFLLQENVPCIAGLLTLNDGSKSVVASGANLFDGTTDVGGWNKTTGVITVSTAGTFTAGAMVRATYYKAESVNDETISDVTDFVLGSATNPSGPTDLVWAKNKMWLACGKLLYRSDSLSPEVFSTAPNELKGGKGVNIMRLIPHTKDRLIAFKGDGSTTGSIHPIDLSSFDSSEWQASIYFDDQSLCSPNAIVRANSADGADIFFATREGLRTLKTTPQDNVAGPSLPIDLTIKDAIGTVTEAQLLSSWAIMYDGEYLRWINDTVWALDMNVPRNSLQEGWTKIYMPASGSIAGIEADCGCVCNFGGGPKLYIGGPDGKIVRMFAVDGGNFTATYEGMGLVPVFNDNKTVFGDMIPLRVGVRVSDESSGLYYAWLKDDKNNVYSLGGNNVGTATPVIASDVSETGTFTIPVGASSAAITFKVPKVNTAFSWVITLHAPEGAVDVIDYANMSDETTTGAIVQLMGAPTQAGWTGTYEVRCTV